MPINYQDFIYSDGEAYAIPLADNATCNDRLTLASLTPSIIATALADLPPATLGTHWVLNECTTVTPPVTTGKKLIVLHGNSIWRGDLASSPSNKIGALLQASLGTDYDVLVYAENGQTTSQMIGQGPAIDSLYDPSKYATHILIPFEITNALFVDGGKSALDAYNEYKSYCLSRKGAVPWKIIVPTVLRRTQVSPGYLYDINTFETARLQINTWTRNEYTLYGDALADIGEMGVENSEGFSIDGLHPRDAGNLIIANELKAKVLGIVGTYVPPVNTGNGFYGVGDAEDLYPTTFQGILYHSFPPSRLDVVVWGASNIQPNGMFRLVNVTTETEDRGNKNFINREWVYDLANYPAYPALPYTGRKFQPLGSPRPENDNTRDPTVNGIDQVYLL